MTDKDIIENVKKVLKKLGLGYDNRKDFPFNVNRDETVDIKGISKKVHHVTFWTEYDEEFAYMHDLFSAEVDFETHKVLRVNTHHRSVHLDDNENRINEG